MKISYNWLKAYLDTDLNPDQVSEKLTAIGLEVEGMESFVSIPGGLEGLVVGHVQTAEKHPDADRLKLTSVDVGGESPLQIVCGAPNVAAGQKVIVAQVGTTLYPEGGDPFKIKRSKIRGVESQGMICAEDEIGIGNDHDGIVVLPEDTAVGTAVSDIYKIEKDTIFDIGLTANRSDAQSHIGVARDLAAALSISDGKTYQVSRPAISDFEVASTDRKIEVTVEAPEACPRYSGVLIDNITVGPSPEWMQNRLKAIGVKVINNIVDITNFILHEYGQPLHAFDADKIGGGKIEVKKLPEGSKFLSLDGEERSLFADDLMICDDSTGMCIAGVYGGLNSGVTESTTSIFLEAAHFDYLHIRRTSTRHNLRTDAASRFEKGTDPNMTVEALKRAANLMREYAGANVASEIVDIYPAPVEATDVSLRLSRLDLLVGSHIPEEDVLRILKALDIQLLSKEGDTLNLKVPSFKPDVLREADLIEEVLRIYGMDKIPLPKHLRTNTVPSDSPNRENYRNGVASYLADNGYFELFTNAIVSSEAINKYLPDTASTAVLLENSLNADLDAMRPSLLFGGLQTVRHNLNHRQLDINCFEFGKVFWQEGDAFKEREHLLLMQTGNKQPENWRQQLREQDFFDLKASALKILRRIGLKDGFETIKSEHPLLNYGLDIQRNGKRLVSFGAVADDVLDGFEIRQPVFAAELDWETSLKQAGKVPVKFNALNRFPTVRRDLALVLDKQIDYAEVEQLARKNGSKLLQDVLLFDSFEGDKIGKDKKSYGIGLFFQDARKTLTDKQVDKIMKQLIQCFESELQASIRR